jgi:DNA-binding NtrC family response regulator
VVLLADHFVRAVAKEMGRPLEPLTRDAIAVLAAHDWPGNVRQLENVIRRLVVAAEGSRISAADCERVLGTRPAMPRTGEAVLKPFRNARAEVLERFEKTYLDALLRACGYNVAEAARRAGMDRKNLWLKLKRHGLGRASLM